MGVPVTLWMVGKKPATVLSFIVTAGAYMFRPLEDIASLSLWDLSSIETNR